MYHSHVSVMLGNILTTVIRFARNHLLCTSSSTLVTDPQYLSSGETRKTSDGIFLLSFRHVFFKKHLIMHLLNNKNYLYQKNIRKKKQVAKHELIVLNCEDIVCAIY